MKLKKYIVIPLYPVQLSNNTLKMGVSFLTHTNFNSVYGKPARQTDVTDTIFIEAKTV